MPTNNFYNQSTIGIVKDTNDPAQMGRLRVYCPTLDSEDFVIDDLPWAAYLSPFGGQIINQPMGPDSEISNGPTSYGFWAIPKVGATVLVTCVNGDPNYRVWLGCFYPPAGNRGLPGGRNVDITKPQGQQPNGPFTDSYEAIQPATKNEATAGLSSNYYYSRGGYERQVAQAQTSKDGNEGYAQNPARTQSGDLDPQTYSITSPGHHFISLQDSPEFCRIRAKTTSGNQIILDDTNQRIYISSALGNNWIEMDEDGHISIYAAQAFSINTSGDFNINAAGVFYVNAADIQLTASSDAAITAGESIDFNSGCSLSITAGDPINIGSTADIIMAGAKIHLNGPEPSTAAIALKPTIIPTHEPFTRPAAIGIQRGKYWQP